MPVHLLCNKKFRLDDPHVLDPRADSLWPALDPAEWSQAIASGFAEPIDFPPIPQAVLAEDTIVIAVEPETPCGLEIAKRVAARFEQLGNSPSRIAILLADPAASPSEGVFVHDPQSSEQMAYLCADRQGTPIYVNRMLFDADIVVPVGSGDGGRMGNQLCPAFCDRETQAYWQQLPSSQAPALARLVDSNLGIFWQIRIVTAPGGQVLRIMVGSSDAVQQQSAELGLQVWQLNIDAPVDMVVATIESESCQTWPHLREAILNADQVAKDDAILVLCTELRGQPPAFWPAGSRSRNKLDASLQDVFQRRHVYLASRLSQAATEKYGFGYLEDSGQIQKLIDQHETCLLLRDAHRVHFQNMRTAERP